MKKQINFSTLQRLDLVDANDLQELIYQIIEELVGGQFQSGQYSVANTNDQIAAIKRNSAHGCLNPVITLGIDQAQSRLNILKPFAVIERNFGELITFTQEEIDAGFGVIDLASLQQEVDDDPGSLRQNDLSSVYSGVGIFAHLLSDTEQESRQFFDIASASTVSNVTTTRNNLRLRLFAGLYEKHINLQNDSGQYPTLIGKYEFGRIGSRVRTDNGGGNFTLNPVSQWFSQASFVSNLVWNNLVPGMNYFDGESLVGDAATPNADKLPSSITSPEFLRATNSGANTLHDLRLGFKYIQRLLNRIHCNGSQDPLTTDLGTRTNSEPIFDNFGVLTGNTKQTDPTLLNEHPPFSLRGLKRIIDVHEHNRPITAQCCILFEKYTTAEDAFPDNIARTIVRSQPKGPSGEIAVSFVHDFYDTFTSYLGVAAPSAETNQMTLGDAQASSNTGVLVNASNAAVISPQAQSSWMRNLIITVPSEYLNYNIAGLSITPITDYSTGASTFVDNVGGLQNNALTAFHLIDEGDNLEGTDTAWQSAPDRVGLTQIKTIAYTSSGGSKASATGLRLLVGPNLTLSNFINNINSTVAGLNITLTLRNNNTLNPN